MSMLFKRIKDWATSITAFRTGDVIPVDGPSGTAKMSKDDLLREAAENADANGFTSGINSYFVDFEQGNFDIIGRLIESTTRIRTKNPIIGNIQFVVPYGYLVASILYYNAETLVFDSIVQSINQQKVTIGKENCVARFTVRKLDGSADITPDEISVYNDKFLKIDEFKSFVGTLPTERTEKYALLEFGNLTSLGKNDHYMGNALFSYKRSKNYFSLKKNEKINFDCVAFGYDDNFSLSWVRYNEANSDFKQTYSWLKVVTEKNIIDVGEDVSWEQGSLSGGLPQASNNHCRTGFLDFEDYKTNYIAMYDAPMTFAIYCYDSNKQFITGRSYGFFGLGFLNRSVIGDSVQDQENVAFIRIVIRYTNYKNFTPETANKICRIGEQIVNPNFDNVEYVSAVDVIKNDANNYSTIRFSYPLYYSKGRDLLNPSMSDKQYDTTIYRNSGLLRLPYNYSQRGNPCPLIIFVHPSDQMQVLNSDNDFYASYASFWDYVQKEGFAVMDCYHTSNKYPNYTHDWGQPVAAACYEQAYKWVCENYNIDQERVFVSSKSQGGIRALLMALGFSSIPIKACGPLAPALGICPQFGYHKYDFNVIAEDCEFEGTMPDISNYSPNDFKYATMPQELKDYVDVNKEKIVGINTFMTNCLSSSAISLYDKLKAYSFEEAEFLSERRLCNKPIKIWIAKDDVNTPYVRTAAFIKQLQNCGCNAEIRIMPNGTGGHGAVSYDNNSIRVESLTTRLGYTCTDIPLAMVELVNWFMKFGG